MKGTLKDNFLTLDCNLNNYCIVPDGAEGTVSDYYTDVCGLASIDKTVYCAKTNTACKSAIYAYSPSEKRIVRITDLPLEYYGVDLAAYVKTAEQGEDLSDLLFLGRSSVNGADKSVILRLGLDGMVKNSYTVNFAAAGLSFYKTEEGQDLFMVLRDSGDQPNLAVEIGTLDDETGQFKYASGDKLNLKNTGYKKHVQGIYYADGPLLLITNNAADTCENAIMVYSNFYCQKDLYEPIARFYVKPASSYYTQFAIKGACADENGILTVAADCNDLDGKAAYRDAVKKIPITFTDQRFEVELGIKHGSHVPNQNKCHNFGTIALDGTTLYGIKAENDTHQLLFKAEDYTDYEADIPKAKSKLKKVQEYYYDPDKPNGEQALLGHANGMELCNNYIFVCGANGIDRLSKDGKFTKRYSTPAIKAKGIAWDDRDNLGKFYVLQSERNISEGYKYYPLHVGRLTGTEYTDAALLSYVRIGLPDVKDGPFKEGTQDIFHRDGIGLFIVYNKGYENDAGKYPVKKNALLHIDIDSISTWDGQPRVIPDYALTVTNSEDFTFEMESGAIDSQNRRLVMCSNYGGGDCVWYTDSDWIFQTARSLSKEDSVNAALGNAK